jgi:two-component system OmpR family sensor kinase
VNETGEHLDAVTSRGRWWDRRTLRFRVLASIVTVMVLAFLVIGLVTVGALNRFLIGRLDQQLRTATNRYVSAASEPAPNGFGDARGQAVGTLGVRVAGGRVVTAGVVGKLQPIPLSVHDQQVLAGLRPGVATSHDLDVGDYRLRVATLHRGELAVVGLPLHSVHDTLGELILIELIVFGVVLLATITSGGLLIRLSLRPLTRVTATAQQVAESPLGDDDPALAERVPTPGPGTEVGRLGVAFNRMLDHVEDSLRTRRDTEDRLRRFIADASHELRTPVAAIRGHAESVRLAKTPVPDEVGESLARIEAEARRMGVLVDDLLLLARLDAGRPLAQEPVDLSRIAIDATSDARVAGRDHRWSLELPEDPVTVVGDDDRLHQVVANLLTNARTHTPPGTSVRIAIRHDTDAATLSVIDDGPGMAPGVRERVFERFFRADPVRAPETGSSGLGLAIVDAVVKAHGGEVEVTSEPGHTCFAVRLPLDRSAQNVAVSTARP